MSSSRYDAEMGGSRKRAKVKQPAASAIADPKPKAPRREALRKDPGKSKKRVATKAKKRQAAGSGEQAGSRDERGRNGTPSNGSDIVNAMLANTNWEEEKGKMIDQYGPMTPTTPSRGVPSNLPNYGLLSEDTNPRDAPSPTYTPLSPFSVPSPAHSRPASVTYSDITALRSVSGGDLGMSQTDDTDRTAAWAAQYTASLLTQLETKRKPRFKLLPPKPPVILRIRRLKPRHIRLRLTVRPLPPVSNTEHHPYDDSDTSTLTEFSCDNNSVG